MIIKQKYFISTFLILSLILLPGLVKNGMFLDGVTYATISRNLSHGLGSIFSPFYTQTLYSAFYQHPPLVFIIQSVFFRILGDSIYTERIYSFFIALILSGLIMMIISRISPIHRKYSWFPVLLWIVIPSVNWALKNNLLENTMSIFTLLSVFFTIYAIDKKKLFLLIISSLSIILAFLCKGPVGLFPIIVPLAFIIGDNFKNWKKMICYQLFLIVSVIVLFILIMILLPELKNNILNYYEEQVKPSVVVGAIKTVNNRFHITGILISQLTIPLIISFLTYLFSRKTIKSHSIESKFNSIPYFIIAVSASFPVIITKKQYGFYITPSYPIYSIAFSIVLIPYLKVLFSELKKVTVQIINYANCFLMLLVLILTFYNTGKYSREKSKLTDIIKICKIIDKDEIIGVSKKTWEDWSLAAYLYRINYISLDCNQKKHYFLAYKEEFPSIESELKDYSKSPLHLENFYLLVYKK